jgi:hypothetical protein
MGRLSSSGSIVLALLLGGSVPSFAQQPSPSSDDEKPPLEELRPTKPSSLKRADEAPPHSEEQPPPSPPPKEEEAAPAAAPRVLLNEGKYQGVAIGGDKLPPRAPKPGKGGAQRLTWSGFQMKDGVPTVFLETTGTPSYTISEKNSALVVRLANTQVHLRNNRRPLKLEAFETTVRSVAAHPRGRDVEVQIETRAPGQPHRERVEPAAGGYQMLVIELPKQ